MFDRIDPTLLPFIDSEARRLLQDGVLPVDDHQALLDEAKKKRKAWESTVEPTEEQLLAFMHEDERAHVRSGRADKQFWDGIKAQWRAKQMPGDFSPPSPPESEPQPESHSALSETQDTSSSDRPELRSFWENNMEAAWGWRPSKDWSDKAFDWLEHQCRAGRIFKSEDEAGKAYIVSQRPPFPNPTQEWYRQDRINRAIQSGQRPDPEDLAEEEADRVRYQRKVAEARERKRKELEAEFASPQDSDKTTRQRHPVVPDFGHGETLGEILLRSTSANVDEAERLIDLSKRKLLDQQESAAELSESVKRHEHTKTGQLNVSAEIKKHRGWYFVAFLLGGLPVGIATIWPTLTDKKVPQWLAEHGWPTLTTLVIGWVAIAVIIALVIIARSYQAAHRRDSERINLSAEKLLEFRNAGGAILLKLRAHHVTAPYKEEAETWAAGVEQYLDSVNGRRCTLEFNNPIINEHISLGANDTSSRTRELFRWLKVRLMRLDKIIEKLP